MKVCSLTHRSTPTVKPGSCRPQTSTGLWPGVWWRPSWGHSLLICILLLWVITWSSSNMRHNHQKTQTYCSHPLFVGWLISVQVLITVRGRGYIFNPFCQRKEIYLSGSNERRQEEGKCSQESATLDKTVISGGVSDKKEKNQSSVTLQSMASSNSRWCMMIQVAEYCCPNWTVLGSLEQTDLLYCHWCITKQRSCKELWVIGFCFFLIEANNQPPLSQQAGDSETKYNLYIYWLCSYPTLVCYRM